MIIKIVNFAIYIRPYAYLDPGSGSMLIQIILGAVLGLGVLVRVFWANIKGFFTKGKKSAGQVADPTAIVEDPTEVGTETQSENSVDKSI